MLILKGHRYDKPVRSLAFSPDGARLASSARDYKTFLWDLSTRKHRVIDGYNSYTVAFSPDGKQIVTGRSNGLTIWDSDTGVLRAINIPFGGWHGAKVGFSPDSRLLVTVSGSVQFWDPHTFQPLPLGAGDHQGADAPNCMAFTRDGKTLATGHDERLPTKITRVIRLWDVAARQVRDVIYGHTAAVGALSFSPDGRCLAATAGTSLWIWDVASSRPIVHHKINDQHYKDVVFSPDGRFLLFARNDATVQVWNTHGWSEVAAYDFTIGPMISLAVSPDGMRAAGGSGKGKIVVFDIDH